MTTELTDKNVVKNVREKLDALAEALKIASTKHNIEVHFQIADCRVASFEAFKKTPIDAYGETQ